MNLEIISTQVVLFHMDELEFWIVLCIMKIFNHQTENCCFDKICLTGEYVNARQLGILTYMSNEVKATNINFTNNEMNGYPQRYGNICILFNQISTNSFSFINFCNGEFTRYGIFSMILFSQMNQELFLSFSNFINNWKAQNVWKNVYIWNWMPTFKWNVFNSIQYSMQLWTAFFWYFTFNAY